MVVIGEERDKRTCGERRKMSAVVLMKEEARMNNSIGINGGKIYGECMKNKAKIGKNFAVGKYSTFTSVSVI